ncbi:MAG: ThuA domain-containing protein [Bryobacterales bacterium]|nr:ThuA domain-containing protein [Bryobacterales bacterium]
MRNRRSSLLAVGLVLLAAAAVLTGIMLAQGPPAAPQVAQAQRGGGAQAPGGQAQPGRGAPGSGAPAPVPGGRGGPAPAPKYHILVIGMTRGYHHGSTSDGLAMFWNLGKETGAWDTEIKTDMSWITKKQPSSEAHSLPFFHAVVFVNTTGDWGLDDEQKEALLSHVRDDGRGIVLAHAAIDANYKWPEFAEMAGGWFRAHPWGTFDAPVIVEDQTFPATRHMPKYLRLFDEMYSAREWSRDKVNVLMRLDESKLDYVNPQYGLKSVREDKDEAIAWAKMYGKGRVFYSSLGHTKEAWDDPLVRQHYLEGVRWVMGRTEGSTASHPKVN